MILKRYDIELENLELPENIIVKMLPSDMLLKDVARSVTNLRFKEVTPAVMRALQMRKDPIDIIDGGLTRGMEIVSTLYLK
ncbi:MAG: methanol--corrinoid methyltransferase, partial [Candidatus Methanomethylophilaceae archaeon]|nr:methanol--corrinoid methyltransferase [Candidatus Methanomethylophilaceae archaeon]